MDLEAKNGQEKTQYNFDQGEQIPFSSDPRQLPNLYNLGSHPLLQSSVQRTCYIEIASKPDSWEASKTELVDNFVSPIVVELAKIGRV